MNGLINLRGIRRLRRREALTQLVEVRVDAVGAGDGAQQPRLQEGGPLVDQAALPPDVALSRRPQVTRREERG